MYTFGWVLIGLVTSTFIFNMTIVFFISSKKCYLLLALLYAVCKEIKKVIKESEIYHNFVNKYKVGAVLDFNGKNEKNGKSRKKVKSAGGKEKKNKVTILEKIKKENKIKEENKIKKKMEKDEKKK